jgi:uncharacterized protein YjbI with pentapeptide repeats
MKARLYSWLQKIKQHPFIATGIIVALMVLITFALAVWIFGWNWTGFNGGESKVTTTIITPGNTTATPRTTVATEQQSAKTLWDWLGLLAALAIPVVVAFGAAWFTAQQGKVSDRENKDNQRENALQSYIDKMSELLLHEDLGESLSNPQVDTIARARTATVLRILDPVRRGSLIQFLSQAGILIKCIQDELAWIDLCYVNLREVDLSRANLSGTNLSGANLNEADLSRTNLSGTNLSGANLSKANLSGANLSKANLSKAKLHEVDLSRANLSGANLSRTFLFRANLSGVDLSKANLSDALQLHLFGGSLPEDAFGEEVFR